MRNQEVQTQKEMDEVRGTSFDKKITKGDLKETIMGKIGEKITIQIFRTIFLKILLLFCISQRNPIV